MKELIKTGQNINSKLCDFSGLYNKLEAVDTISQEMEKLHEIFSYKDKHVQECLDAIRDQKRNQQKSRENNHCSQKDHTVSQHQY